jgi:hypothetical protein
VGSAVAAVAAAVAVADVVAADVRVGVLESSCVRCRDFRPSLGCLRCSVVVCLCARRRSVVKAADTPQCHIRWRHR